MHLMEMDSDLIIFNSRPLVSLVRLTQTISGRPGRIKFPLPFGQIWNHSFYFSLVPCKINYDPTFKLNYHSRSDWDFSPARSAGLNVCVCLRLIFTPLLQMMHCYWLLPKYLEEDPQFLLNECHFRKLIYGNRLYGGSDAKITDVCHIDIPVMGNHLR